MIELMLIGGIIATPFGIMVTKFFTKKLPIIRFSGLAGSVLAFPCTQTSILLKRIIDENLGNIICEEAKPYLSLIEKSN